MRSCCCSGGLSTTLLVGLRLLVRSGTVGRARVRLMRDSIVSSSFEVGGRRVELLKGRRVAGSKYKDFTRRPDQQETRELEGIYIR